MAEKGCEHHDSSDFLCDTTLDQWKECWQGENRAFHMEFAHPILLELKDSLINGRENIKIYVPLCGKIVDMVWLSKLGHTVVGTEISDIACKEFFVDNKIDYTEMPLTGIQGTLFKSKDEKIKLYCCDFFHFTSDFEGKFDAIWDRGSLFAINVGDQSKYADHIVPLMEKNCRYLLEVETFVKEGKSLEFGDHLNESVVRKHFEGMKNFFGRGKHISDKSCTVEKIYGKEQTGAFFDVIKKEMECDQYIINLALWRKFMETNKQEHFLIK